MLHTIYPINSAKKKTCDTSVSIFHKRTGLSERREKRKLTFQSSISKEERLGLCEMPLAHNHLDILPKSPKISFLLYGSNLRWSHFNQKTCQIWPFSPAGIQIDGTLSSSFSPGLISRLIHTLLVAWSLTIIIASIIESIGSVFVFKSEMTKIITNSWLQ